MIFKIGDRVVYVGNYENIPREVGVVDKVDTDVTSSIPYRVEWKENGSTIGRYWLPEKDLCEIQDILSISARWPTTYEQEAKDKDGFCTCDLRDLLLNGCTCGGK